MLEVLLTKDYKEFTSFIWIFLSDDHVRKLGTGIGIRLGIATSVQSEGLGGSVVEGVGGGLVNGLELGGTRLE